MAAAWRTGCAFRWRCSAPCAPSGRRTSRCRCASPPPTGSRAASPPDDAVEIARAFKAGRRRPHRRFRRPDLDRGAAGLWPHVPDAVRRPHPQRGRHRHHGGRQHHRDRPPQLHHRRRAAPISARWRGRIWPTRTSRCTPRRSLAIAEQAWPQQYLAGKAAARAHPARAPRRHGDRDMSDRRSPGGAPSSPAAPRYRPRHRRAGLRRGRRGRLIGRDASRVDAAPPANSAAPRMRRRRDRRARRLERAVAAARRRSTFW